MCGYFSTGFIDFKSKGKISLEHTNLFCPNYHEKKQTNKKKIK